VANGLGVMPRAVSRFGEEEMSEQTVEKELWQGSYSSKAMAVAWLLGALLLVVGGTATIILIDNWGVRLALLILLALPMFYCLLVAWYRSLTLHYKITTRRLVSQSGLLNMSIERVALMSISDVSCHQNGLDRLFGIGTIVLQSTDATDPVFKMCGIEDVQVVLGILDQACTLARASATVSV